MGFYTISYNVKFSDGTKSAYIVARIKKSCNVSFQKSRMHVLRLTTRWHPEALSPQLLCFGGQGQEEHYKIVVIPVVILIGPGTLFIYAMDFRPFCDWLYAFMLLCILCSFFILSLNANITSYTFLCC